MFLSVFPLIAHLSGLLLPGRRAKRPELGEGKDELGEDKDELQEAKPEHENGKGDL